MPVNPILYIIIPCYNDRRILPITLPELEGKLVSMIRRGKISGESRILFVDDGSTDTTWKSIQKYAAEDQYILGLSLSRRHGYQNAVLAGLMEAKECCDITVTIDCGGQDDINAIDEMIDAYARGYEVVYSMYAGRKTGKGYGTEHRLISSRVLNEFENFHEVNLFLTGMIPLVGFKSTTVTCEHTDRAAGASHYPPKKSFAQTVWEITSQSVKPLHMIVGAGLLMSALSAVFLICIPILSKLQFYFEVWEIMTGILFFASGLQFIAMGLLGEYIGQIHIEAKKRPRYIIAERTWTPFRGAHEKVYHERNR